MIYISHKEFYLLLLQIEETNIYVFYKTYSLVLSAYRHGSAQVLEAIAGDTYFVRHYIFYIWFDNKLLPMHFVLWTKALLQVSISQDQLLLLLLLLLS